MSEPATLPGATQLLTSVELEANIRYPADTLPCYERSLLDDAGEDGTNPACRQNKSSRRQVNARRAFSPRGGRVPAVPWVFAAA